MNLQQLFRYALSQYQQNNYVGAAELLKNITKMAPSQPEGWHLLALTLRKQDKLTESESCFEKCMQLNPDDAEILNNFANLKRQQQMPDDAEQLFRKAIKLKPDFVDAWYNLSLLLSLSKRHRASIECLRKVKSLQPTHKAALQALIAEYLHEGLLEEADKLLASAPNEYQSDIYFLISKAMLLRKQGYASEGVAFMLPLQKHPAALRELVLCCYAAGETEQAKQLLTKQLELLPTDPLWLHLSAELGWQNADTGWLNHYQRALEHKNVPPLVYLEYANKLQKTGDFIGAEQIIDRGLELSPQSGGLLLLKGYLRREAGAFDESLVWLIKAEYTGQVVKEALSEQVVTLMALEQVDSAITILEKLCHSNPLDQACWALLAACYKLSGNESFYRALYDFDKFIRVYQLGVAEGFRDIESFNQQLLAKLHSLHTCNQHPLQQSLRQGTQTDNHLFHRKDAILKQLQQQISVAVSQYIQMLPEDIEHPFLKRQTMQFKYSGSWSVRLRQQGFHRNHYHGDGWISGCYYVHIPGAVNKSGSGWIKFGQPELGRHIISEADYLVKPKEGMLVLFPSMMWHGTEPFNDEHYRVTVAFDIVPQLNEDEL